MYVRLAFAVAAHLDPEILLVDEVLAVGDAAFQKKCLGKMGEVAAGGRTVLFVSHRMTAVKTLCPRSLWLDSGRIIKEGETQDIVASYLSEGWTPELAQSWNWEEAPGNELVKLLTAEVKPLNGSQILMGEPLELSFTVAKLVPRKYRLDVTFHLVDEMGTLVFVGSSAYEDIETCLGRGVARFACRIPPHLMNEGTYTITRFLILKDRGTCLYEHRDLLRFEIVNPGRQHLGWMGKKEGTVRPKLDWSVERSPL
jgi:lipopolysaccharide transport system ATP-binding protein